MPFQSMRNKVLDFIKDETSKVLFLHIREPEEIARAVKEFGAKTILIVRPIKQIVSNIADKGVYDYQYDFVINNNGTIEDLKEKAKDFLQKECLWEVIL